MDKTPLGIEGFAYIRNAFLGCGEFAEKLERKISSYGSVYAWLPDEISPHREKQFHMGGFGSSEGRVSLLLSSIASYPSGTLIVYDSWAKPEDLGPDMNSWPLSAFVYEDCVFHTIQTADLTYSALVDLLRKPNSFLISCLLVKEELINVRREANFAVSVGGVFFDLLLGNLLSVHVSAYDQESWVVWEEGSIQSIE